MATFQSVNTVLALSGPTASGGIAGGPQFPRSPAAAGKLQIGVDSYVTAGTETTGSVIEFWPQMPSTSRLVYGMISWGALGSGALLSVGKIDPNNSANTDAVHYLNPAEAANNPGSALFNNNVGEQVGQDPLGDSSTGQAAPGFGALPIILTATITGATAAASQNIVVVFFFVSGT